MHPGFGIGALLADLPALRSHELRTALDAAAALAGTSFVRDAAGGGTTALLARRRQDLLSAFGPGSAAARLSGGAVELEGDGFPSLRHDVDSPSDLALALKMGVGVHTATFVQRLWQSGAVVPVYQDVRTVDHVSAAGRKEQVGGRDLFGVGEATGRDLGLERVALGAFPRLCAPSSVGTTVGEMVLTVTPRPAHSDASTRRLSSINPSTLSGRGGSFSRALVGVVNDRPRLQQRASVEDLLQTVRSLIRVWIERALKDSEYAALPAQSTEPSMKPYALTTPWPPRPP